MKLFIDWTLYANKNMCEDIDLILTPQGTYGVPVMNILRPIRVRTECGTITIDGYIYCKESFTKLPMSFKICRLSTDKKMSSDWLLYPLVYKKSTKRCCARTFNNFTLRCKVQTDGTHLLFVIYDILGITTIKNKRVLEKIINIENLNNRLSMPNNNTVYSCSDDRCRNIHYSTNEFEYLSVDYKGGSLIKYKHDCYLDFLHFDLINVKLRHL